MHQTTDGTTRRRYRHGFQLRTWFRVLTKLRQLTAQTGGSQYRWLAPEINKERARCPDIHPLQLNDGSVALVRCVLATTFRRPPCDPRQNELHSSVGLFPPTTPAHVYPAVGCAAEPAQRSRVIRIDQRMAPCCCPERAMMPLPVHVRLCIDTACSWFTCMFSRGQRIYRGMEWVQRNAREIPPLRSVLKKTLVVKATPRPAIPVLMTRGSDLTHVVGRGLMDFNVFQALAER